MFFIYPSQLPLGRKATYLKIVTSYRPQKEDPYRIRFTLGGDKLTDYAGPYSAPTAVIQTAKCLFNSVISTWGARFSVLDLENFCLGNPLPRYDYMWIPGQHTLDEIIHKHQLHGLGQNGHVLV